MQERRTSGTPSRFTKYRALMIAGAVMLVGGAGFAATDTGASAIKKLLVFVSIDGEESQLTLELMEGGEGTWTMDNEDGGQTTVHLSHSPDGEGVLAADMASPGEPGLMTVDVDVTGAESGDKTVDIAVGGEPGDGTIVIDTKGGADRLGELMNQEGDAPFFSEDVTTDGQGNTVHIVKESAGDGNVKVIELTGDPADHQKRMVKLNALLAKEAEEATNVDVEVGEDGVATITLTYTDGTEVVRTIDLGDQEDGEITVTVDETGEVSAGAAKTDR